MAILIHSVAAAGLSTASSATTPASRPVSVPHPTRVAINATAQARFLIILTDIILKENGHLPSEIPVSQTRNTRNCSSLMEKMRRYGADYKDVTADVCYEREENYSW